MRSTTLLLITFLFFACDNTDKGMRFGIESGSDALLEVPMTTQTQAQGPIDDEQITKKIIKTGSISFQSINVEETYQAIAKVLSESDAYIEHENQYKGHQRINYQLTIRVPSHQYDTLLTSLAGMAFRIDSKTSNIEDVTERYYDLKSRIRNKKVLEQRYLELLKKATSISDILEIEKNLNEVRMEIEQLQGQFNYLSKQIGFSTIRLSFYEELPYTYDTFKRKGFGIRLTNAFSSGWQGFLSFLVGFTALWPFVLLIAGGIYGFKKFRAFRKRKKQ